MTPPLATGHDGTSDIMPKRKAAQPELDKAITLRVDAGPVPIKISIKLPDE